MDVCPTRRFAYGPSSWPDGCSGSRSSVNPSLAIHPAQQECHRDEFVIAHLLNLAAGANLAATLLQIVYALAIGLMYAALALRTQTILPLIVTHGLTDFFGFIALNSAVVTTGINTLAFVVTAGEIIIYLSYSIILMRQVKRQSL